MNEDEARQKECPFKQNPSAMAIGIGVTVVPKDVWNGNCTASDCACWVVTDNEAGPSDGTFPTVYKSAGHCGLTK